MEKNKAYKLGQKTGGLLGDALLIGAGYLLASFACKKKLADQAKLLTTPSILADPNNILGLVPMYYTAPKKKKIYEYEALGCNSGCGCNSPGELPLAGLTRRQRNRTVLASPNSTNVSTDTKAKRRLCVVKRDVKGKNGLYYTEIVTVPC